MIGAFTQLLPHVDSENAVFAFSLLLQSLCVVADVRYNSQQFDAWAHSANHASPVHFDDYELAHKVAAAQATAAAASFELDPKCVQPPVSQDHAWKLASRTVKMQQKCLPLQRFVHQTQWAPFDEDHDDALDA
eukprot:10564915-Karenia_brevis.AAC.1